MPTGRIRTSQERPFEALARMPYPRMLMRQGGAWWVAGGAAATLDAEGPDRLSRVREGAQALFSALEVTKDAHAPPQAGPRLVGGFAFAPDRPAGPWTGFAAASFWLPSRLVVWPAGADGPAWECAVEGGAACPTPKRSVPEAPAQDFPALVRAALEAIREGTLDKVVAARCEGRPGQEARALAMRLAASEAAGTLFLVAPYKHLALVGATPERLVSVEMGTVATQAVAGSAPTGEGPALLVRAKEGAEHAWVVRHIEERLVGLGLRPQCGAAQLLAMRTVHHILTPITADRGGRHVLEVAQALHPTPAVCGSPPEAAAHWIARNEGLERGWYTGAVGWFDAQGQGELDVALRCALVTPDGSLLWAGAGIVAGSDPGAEFRETEAKLATLREAFA